MGKNYRFNWWVYRISGCHQRCICRDVLWKLQWSFPKPKAPKNLAWWTCNCNLFLATCVYIYIYIYVYNTINVITLYTRIYIYIHINTWSPPPPPRSTYLIFHGIYNSKKNWFKTKVQKRVWPNSLIPSTMCHRGTKSKFRPSYKTVLSSRITGGSSKWPEIN